MATTNHNANKAGSATSANLTPASGVVTGLNTNGTVTKDFGSGSTTYYRYNGFAVGEDVSKYFEYSFSVASGYAFTPSKITVGWAPNGGKAVCFNIYAGTSASNLVKIGQLIHNSDNTYATDEHTTFTALGENTNFTMIRLVPCGKASSIILNSVAIEGSLVTDSRSVVALSFASTSGSVDVADIGATLPTLTTDPNVTAITNNISYSSSNTGVATVNPSTGVLALIGIGTTTITASFAGDATYMPASDTYTLTVTDRTKLGYAEVLNPDNKTVGARWTFGINHASVSAPLFGSQVNNYPARSSTMYLNGTAAANQYASTSTWYKTVNEAAYQDNQWVGYDITVEDGYALNLTNLAARLLLSDDVTLKWKVVITDKNYTQLYTSTDQTTTRASTADLSQSLSLSTLTGTVHVRVYMHSTGSTKGFSIEKLILTGATVVDPRPEYTITFAEGTGSGTAPADVTIREGETFFFPAAPLLYKTGSTLTAWNDGTSNHNVGTSVAVNADIDLTAQFTANTVALGDEATTVEWTFKTANGAPTIALEGNSGVYSKRTLIGETPFDALMTIDATSGKFNNSGNATYAQVNADTKFTIPAVKGMVVTISCNQPTTAVTNATFDGDDATSFDGSARTLTYTYEGTKSSIDVIVKVGGLYPDGISVVYPMGKYTKPTIVKGDFSFENKGYKVTITKTEGDNLMVSTDGSAYTAQTSPYVTYATETTTFYAKTTGSEKEDSKVASLEVTNTFNIAKPYIAWVYENGYGSANYAFNTDPMVSALQSIYNVVEIKLAQSTDPTTATDISNADLIVCTEAMAGNKTLSNKMEDYVGTTPMIGLKFFNYTSGRWDWGTPANPSSTTLGFTPSSTLYKVLDGVTYENDGTIRLATQSLNSGSQKNVVQTVTWSSAPSGKVDMGTADNKIAMHCATKYFGLGLSSDCWQYYTANAITIVKNAAAMLIAGEALDAEVATVSGEITASGYNTFSSSYALDLSTIANGTAYVASSVTDGKVVLTKVADKIVAAGTGLMIAGTAGDDFTINTTADAATFTGDNLFVGMPNGGEVAVAGEGYNYVFGWTEVANPGFYKVVSDLPSLEAGKAYLHTTAELGATSARLALSFEDEETTGIENLTPALSQGEGAFYDLQGRRVAQPQKGLYIVNGKKIVVK